MNRLILCVGLPGCGKSSVYRKYYKSRGFVHCSADLVRMELLQSKRTKNYFDVDLEPTVWKLYWQAFNQHLNTHADLFIDNTNLTKRQRAQHIIGAQQIGYTTKILFFHYSARLITKMNQARNNPAKIVKQSVIVDMREKLEPVEHHEADMVLTVHHWSNLECLFAW